MFTGAAEVPGGSREIKRAVLSKWDLWVLKKLNFPHLKGVSNAVYFKTDLSQSHSDSVLLSEGINRGINPINSNANRVRLAETRSPNCLHISCLFFIQTSRFGAEASQKAISYFPEIFS